MIIKRLIENPINNGLYFSIVCLKSDLTLISNSTVCVAAKTLELNINNKNKQINLMLTTQKRSIFCRI